MIYTFNYSSIMSQFEGRDVTSFGGQREPPPQAPASSVAAPYIGYSREVDTS